MSTKFSQFIVGGPPEVGDIIVGLRSGNNTQFTWTPGGSTSVVVTQMGHGFGVGNVVRLNGLSYVLAQADTLVDAEVVGMVGEVIDANDFVLVTNGLVSGLSGLIPGDVYYLDPIAPGALTVTPPSTVGQVDKVLLISNTVTSGYFLNYPGNLFTNLEMTGNSLISLNVNGPINLAPNGSGQIYASNTFNLQSASSLLWYNTANTHYSGFKANTGLSSSTLWILPTADGTSGEVLTTDGSGNLSFQPASSSGSAMVNLPVVQANHRFSVGDVVIFNGTIYVLAQADNAIDAEVIGVVSVVTDANDFILTTEGFVTGLSDLISGSVYFLSDATPGLLTLTEPSTASHISKPLMIAISTTEGYFHNWRGKVIPTISSANLAFSGNDVVSLDTNGPINFVPNGSGQVFSASNFNVQSDSALQLYNSANTFYSGLKAASALGASTTWTLPTADGTSGQVLSTDGSGVLSFITVSGGTVDASAVTYEPATPANWPTPPAFVAPALDDLAATGVLGPFSAGSVIYSNGTKLTQDNANFNWNDSTGTFHVLQPSSVPTLNNVVTITSDPSGAHGHGNHLCIDGNPEGGGTIFRTDQTGTNASWIQMTGGDHTCTGGGTIYVNGNVSTESGAEGCVQTTFGLSTSSFQMYDYTQSTLLFQLNNSGVLQLPLLTASSALATDASHNIVASSTTATELGYVHGVTSSIQAQINALSGGGLTWNVVTSNTAMSAGNGYFVNSASPINMTLPSTISVGGTIQICNMGTAGFTILQNPGQQIQFGNETTTLTSGSIASTNTGDAINLVCNVANTKFFVTPGTQGNLTIV